MRGALPTRAHLHRDADRDIDRALAWSVIAALCVAALLAWSFANWGSP